MTYDKKDVPQFQEDVCKKTCIMNGKCVDDGKDSHWFLMCPHYHSWKIGYTSFIWEQIKWERDHPEEVKLKIEQNKEVAKKIRESKKGKKTVTGE